MSVTCRLEAAFSLFFWNVTLSFYCFVQNKTNQIVPEFTVDLKGASICWATKDKSSKKNVLEVCWRIKLQIQAWCHGLWTQTRFR